MKKFAPFLFATLSIFPFSALAADAADTRVEVSEQMTLETVDQTVQAVDKKGVVSTYKVMFTKGKLDVNLNSEGYASYVFNHYSMCMPHDLGDLYAPFTFKAVDDKGVEHQITVTPSTGAVPVRVSAICPKPGEVQELYLSTDVAGANLFPTDIAQDLTAQLQAQITATAEYAAGLAAAQKLGLKTDYVYVDAKQICFNLSSGKDCNYHLILTLSLSSLFTDSDGFFNPQVGVGAITEADYQSWLTSKGTARPQLITHNFQWFANWPLRTSSVQFRSDGTFQIQYGMEGTVDNNMKEVAPSAECTLNATLDAQGVMQISNARTANCQADFPAEKYLGDSYSLNAED